MNAIIQEEAHSLYVKMKFQQDDEFIIRCLFVDFPWTIVEQSNNSFSSPSVFGGAGGTYRLN
jgi:hypothetical protein